MDKTKKTNILIIGGGQGGTALLDILHNDPTANVLGLVDINPDAKGIILAKKMGLTVSKYATTFFRKDKPTVDLLIDVTDNSQLREELNSIKPKETKLIGGITARFIWQLIDTQKEKRQIEQQYQSLKASLQNKPNEQLIFGSNPRMQQIRQMIYQVAETPATVLLIGETGTGKEMIAKTIQELSHLRNKPFIKINCTAFTPSLLESELFGYKKGAFTGATKDRKGLLEKGNGGTIFLDEIGDISLDMQVKLLRFLQFGEIRPVGATSTKTIKARIIAATNRNLEELIEQDKFRRDLYYRLNSFTLELPRLKERKEDIPVLAYHFLKQAVIKINKKVSSFSQAAIEYLIEYDYPGNLREMQSIIERAVILCDRDMIEVKHLPFGVQSTTPSYQYKNGLVNARNNVISQFERQALHHYLSQANGNVSLAAATAKMPRRSFYRLLEKYKIEKDAFLKKG